MTTINIIGAGHNGLVCACYLAKAGFTVTLFERRSVVGGAAVTEEICPGFRNSTASYTVSLLQEKIINELHLKQHGLQLRPRAVNNVLPLDNGQSLVNYPSLKDTQDSVAQFSQKDAEALIDYYEDISQSLTLIKEQLLKAPPNFTASWQNLPTFLSFGKTLWRQRRSLESCLNLLTCSAGHYLERYFESEPIQALLGFDSIVGHYASPYSPNSAYILLHHVMGELDGVSGQWGHAMGGMGSISEALRTEAESLGIKIITNAAVDRLLLEKNVVKGFVLDNGEQILGDVTVANVNPKLLFNNMCDQAALPADFVQKMKFYRCASGTFRINVALNQLPNFSAISGEDKQHLYQAGIIIAPTLRYMEQAYFDAKTHGYAKHPIIEMLIPSVIDPSLAPQGQHVASLFCQHFTPPNASFNWDLEKNRIKEIIYRTIDKYAPKFTDSIIGERVLSPLDLERTFGLVGGDIFHGCLAINQLFSFRPVLGYADYRTPLRNLYLCGAGSHPGGGVTGAPGHNAAQAIIYDQS